MPMSMPTRIHLFGIIFHQITNSFYTLDAATARELLDEYSNFLLVNVLARGIVLPHGPINIPADPTPREAYLIFVHLQRGLHEYFLSLPTQLDRLHFLLSISQTLDNFIMPSPW